MNFYVKYTVKYVVDDTADDEDNEIIYLWIRSNMIMIEIKYNSFFQFILLLNSSYFVIISPKDMYSD